jgi:ankyrin repeat protein
LIKAGAQVDAQNHAGNTALMVAAKEGYSDAARALLAAGADYALHNAETKDAFQIAREHENEVICDLLKAAGAVETLK